MSKNLMFNVSEAFDLEAFSDQITQMYQAKGYNVRTLKMKGGVKITVEKGVGGINTLLGLGRAITVTCNIHGKDKDTFSANFSDGDWTGKIIGLVAGWFLCFVPFVTAIVGIVKQLGLEKDMQNDIQMTVLSDE